MLSPAQRHTISLIQLTHRSESIQRNHDKGTIGWQK
jgi:hypothetical protein